MIMKSLKILFTGEMENNKGELRSKKKMKINLIQRKYWKKELNP